MKSSNLARKLLENCKNKVSVSLLYKNSYLVTADLTADDWGPMAKLILNAFLEATDGNVDLPKKLAQRIDPDKYNGSIGDEIVSGDSGSERSDGNANIPMDAYSSDSNASFKTLDSNKFLRLDSFAA